MATQQQIRRVVWTGAITAVTVAGAWYGAGLKESSDVRSVSPSSTLPVLKILIAKQ
jgi:hypothetical protein